MTYARHVMHTHQEVTKSPSPNYQSWKGPCYGVSTYTYFYWPVSLRSWQYSSWLCKGCVMRILRLPDPRAGRGKWTNHFEEERGTVANHRLQKLLHERKRERGLGGISGFSCLGVGCIFLSLSIVAVAVAVVALVGDGEVDEIDELTEFTECSSLPLLFLSCTPTVSLNPLTHNSDPRWCPSCQGLGTWAPGRLGILATAIPNSPPSHSFRLLALVPSLFEYFLSFLSFPPSASSSSSSSFSSTPSVLYIRPLPP